MKMGTYAHTRNSSIQRAKDNWSLYHVDRQFRAHRSVTVEFILERSAARFRPCGTEGKRAEEKRERTFREREKKKKKGEGSTGVPRKSRERNNR